MRNRFVVQRDDAWVMMYRNNFDGAVKVLEGLHDDEATNFRLGYAYTYSNSPRRAVGHLEKLPETSWRNYALALAHYRALNYNKAVEIVSNSSFDRHIRYRAERLKYDALKESKSYEDALAQLKYLRKSHPSDIGPRTYSLEKLRLLRLANRKTEAISLLDEILNRHDSFSRQAAELMKDEAIPASMYIKMANALYEGRRYTLARTFYEKHVAGPGKNDGLAIFRIARSNDRSGRYSVALEQYRKIQRDKSYDEGWAVYGIIRSLRKLNRHKEALSEMEKHKAVWQRSSAEPLVLWEGYEIGRETLDYKLAAESAGELFKKHPTHNLGDNGVLLAGVFHVLNDDYDKANEFFRAIHQSGRFSQERFMNIGRYWTNRVDVSYIPDPRPNLPDFYTYHTHAEGLIYDISGAYTKPLEIDWDTTIDSLFSILRSGWFKEATLDENDPHLRWARFFGYWGMLKWAKIEYEAYIDKTTDLVNTTASLQLFEELKDVGLTNPAYELGLKIVSSYTRNVGEPPKILYRLSYPVFFEDLLSTYCPSYGVDPLFVLSVMRQESRYDRDATSWADARGLMQVIPKTGQTIANSLRKKNYKSSDLYDPHLSIEFGAYLLGDLLERMGDQYSALAAYNAGEAPVRRWKSIPMAQTDPLIFTEIVDFRETRHYLRHVMENYFRYHDIWR